MVGGNAYLCRSVCLLHFLSLLFVIPPCINGGRGGLYWNHFVHLSCSSSVYVPDHVHSVSDEPLNHFFTKLGMVVIITRQYV